MNPKSNPFSSAGSGLIRGGLSAYGEKIFGSGSEVNGWRYQYLISKCFSDPQYYFQVNDHYVRNKLKIVLLPFLNRGHWTRITEPVGGRLSYEPPINDINAPDLYIPCMSFATYLVLAGISLGLSGK
ncbi:INTEGRAL MEMBRANE HRF1 FAMILY PROTEIN [Salix purpurea]|uniref:INTEGRAL MEMBRANE HRF1 FAMILY PROTEIN n=1 Tax=Salix purpurea TaxID=77065 RepID=A0A9Q0P328_SALPP|nr:INTEGRAL MEMBRANE HRF1 FAMILY PROTEIN [Salix purpurea]